MAQSASLELAGALGLLPRIKSAPVCRRAHSQMGFDHRPGSPAEGCPTAADGCLHPRWEVWAVGPLLASQTGCWSRECSDERPPSNRVRAQKAGFMLPASVEPSLEGGEPQSPVWGHGRALC